MGDETSLQSIGALGGEPVMTVRSRRRPSERAFSIFRRMVVEQAAAADVMAEFGISRQRVYFLVRRVTKWSKEHEGVGDVLAIKVQHTAMLYELWRDARRQWKRSCEDATHHSIVSVEGLMTAAGTALPKKTTTRVSRKGQSGNPRYIEVCDTLLASIRGIWGADAPKQVDIATTNEHHVTVVTVERRAALAIEKLDEELARRGCVHNIDVQSSDSIDAGSRRAGDPDRPSTDA